MKANFYFQFISIAATAIGLFLTNAYADRIGQEERYRQLSEIVQNFLSDDAKLLRPYLDPTQIKIFQNRSTKVNMYLDDLYIDSFREPNGEFLGMHTRSPLADDDFNEGTWMLFLLYDWETPIHLAQLESIIFHFIAQSFKLETIGDFHLTHTFYDERKAFWEQYLQNPSACSLKVINRETDAEIRTVKLHNGPNLIPLDDHYQLNLNLLTDFTQLGGFTYQKVRSGDSLDKKKPAKMHFSIYDLLLGHFPTYEFTVDRKLVFQLSCSRPK